MKKITLLFFVFALNMVAYSQTSKLDSTLQTIKLQRDSTLRAMIHGDSAKVVKEFSIKMNEARLKSMAIFPAINGGEGSGVIPVEDPAEIPDPALDYKLLFALSEANPDSAAGEINFDLTEVARIINLHVASGIPLKKIFPVIIARGGIIKSFMTNEYFKKHFKRDNPNMKLIDDLAALGTKFIVCGQSMAYNELKKESMLPLVKVSLTSKTVLSSYQLKGYVIY